MRLTNSVIKILKNYESDLPSVRTNLARMLMHGKLAGSGKVVILPVDQGFEHGPGRSFYMNEKAYDPHYHYTLAVRSGVSAFAAPLGLLEAGVETFLGQVPLILKINSSNTLMHANSSPDQAVTSSVKDAARLGCVGIGFTLYPGSDNTFQMIEEAKDAIAEAKSYGLFTVLWSYPRGKGLSKIGETALDVISYGAHVCALIGAHVVKVKLPSAHIEIQANQGPYQSVQKDSLKDRVSHVVQSCFNGRRIVVFSGGETKNSQEILEEIKAIYQGGGFGSIIGRNCFQRPYEEALGFLKDVHEIYRGREANEN